MIMQHTFRKGIAMIELIFAIIIMGIVLSSAPMLISQSSGSSFVAFQQESIAIASSHINTLSTYAWDEENTDSKSPNFLLNVPAGNAELTQQDTTVKRGPTYALAFATNRLRQYSDINITIAVNTFPALGGAEENATEPRDDIDDFIGIPLALVNAAAQNQANQGEYMDTGINMATAVIYGFDRVDSYTNANGRFTFNRPFTANPFPEDNIKLITTILTSNIPALNGKNIILRAFMCNIGAASSQDAGGLY